MTLPNDVARCVGVQTPDRQTALGCKSCQRHKSLAHGDDRSRVMWVAPAVVIDGRVHCGWHSQID